MTYRVLIVEDNRSFSRVLKDSIERAGIEVETVENGVEAVLRYLDGGIDLLLMDIVMPRMSGLDAMRILKKYDPEIKAILFSGNPTQHILSEVAALGTKTFLTKPFSMEDLITGIQLSLNNE